jgi:GDP-4-dehydro-6-deoxy-D-mannose reductase
VTGHDLLVTGTSGFVGRWVSERALGAGLSVGAASGDLRDPAVADREVSGAAPAAVIHAAAAAGRGDERAVWQALADDVAMAGALLRAIREHAPDAPVLIPGSAAQYGMGTSRRLREDDPTVPVSGYGSAKCVLEEAVLAEPLRAGTRVIWTRSFNHLGPRQGTDAPAAQWARQVVQAERAGGGVLRTGNLDVVRDFLDVRDVADAYIALVRTPDAAGVVNVCSGEATRLGELAQLFVQAARVEVTLTHDPGLQRPLDPPQVVGDPGRLHDLTGWSPRIELAESVRDLLAEVRDSANPSAGSLVGRGAAVGPSRSDVT